MAYLFAIISFCLMAASAAVPTGRVAGGQDAKQGEFPHHISVRKYGNQLCAGSLIEVNKTQVIVSSAYCILIAPETVVGGDLSLSDFSGLEQYRNVAYTIMHPDYNFLVKWENDIGLIFIDEPFEINANVAPIPLPAKGLANPTGNVLITGWGNGTTLEQKADILQKVEVPVLNSTQCGDGSQLPAYTFCTGAVGKGACPGDGGGPLKLANSNYLVAIDLGSYTCGDLNEPPHNTNVSPFVDWIESAVAKYTSERQ